MCRRSARATKGRGKKLKSPPVTEDLEAACVDCVGARKCALTGMASQTEQPGQSSSTQPGLADVLAAIGNCQASLTTLTTKVDAVQLDVGLIRLDMDKIRSRLSTAEQRRGHWRAMELISMPSILK